MKNTKLLFFALLAAAALLFAAGCSDSDDSGDSSLSSSLVGTWEYTETYDSGSTFTWTYVFKSDGTFAFTRAYTDGADSYYDHTSTTEGTWSLSGSMLTLTESETYEGYGSYTFTKVYSVAFSGNNMTLTLVSESNSYSYTDGESETWMRPSTLAYSSEDENSMQEGDSITLTRVD